IQPGDVVGIGIHTGNALRGMALGKIARARGAYVVYGGIHATLYPNEAAELGGAHTIVKGDGDVIWGKVIADLLAGTAQPVYDGGRISGDQFIPARWDLAPRDKYMWASVQTVRGCPKHCSFCSVWRTSRGTRREWKNCGVFAPSVLSSCASCRSCPRTWCSLPRSRWKPARTPSFSMRCG